MQEYESFAASDVRYYDDCKFPFRLLKDVPKIVKRLSFNSINWVSVE